MVFVHIVCVIRAKMCLSIFSNLFKKYVRWTFANLEHALVWDDNFAPAKKCHCGIKGAVLTPQAQGGGRRKTVEELTVIGEHPLWQRNANQAMRDEQQRTKTSHSAA